MFVSSQKYVRSGSLPQMAVVKVGALDRWDLGIPSGLYAAVPEMAFRMRVCFSFSYLFHCIFSATGCIGDSQFLDFLSDPERVAAYYLDPSLGGGGIRDVLFHRFVNVTPPHSFQRFMQHLQKMMFPGCKESVIKL